MLFSGLGGSAHELALVVAVERLGEGVEAPMSSGLGMSLLVT